MCPSMAEGLFFYIWSAHMLAREALCIGNRLIVWKAADALGTIMNCGKKALIVVGLLRVDVKAKRL